jgi:hypothetical protein
MSENNEISCFKSLASKQRFGHFLDTTTNKNALAR